MDMGMTKGRVRRGAVAAAVAGLIATSWVVLPAAPAGAGAPITVTTLADVVSPGAPVSLREAITAANADGNPAAITLGVSGEYLLTQCGGVSEEDANANGDLDFLESDGITIAPGFGVAPATIRQTCPEERVLQGVGLGQLFLQNVTITGGDIASAGAGILSLGSVILTSSAVVDNHSTGANNGGGINAFSVSLTDSEVRGNSAQDGGGTRDSVSTTLTRSSITGNTASRDGGGVLGDSTVTLVNSTVAGNEAFRNGGGIRTTGSVSLGSSTVAGNQALIGVGPAVDGGSLTANRSLIARNTGQDFSVIPQCDVSSSTSNGFNVTGGSSCNLNGGTDIQNTDAGVPPNTGLRDVFRNGGPGQTVWPAEDSPAIDFIPAAQCGLTVDQRGAPRNGGLPCDAGAVEVQPCGSFFGDVPSTHQFCDEIGWMNEAGITTGFFPGPIYKPTQNVTRQSMSAFMYRLAGSPAFADPVTATFSDVATTSQFFTEIEWMSDEGITTGFPGGLYKPSQNVTRASMSAFMFRLADGHVADFGG
jgi:hypothetical protein